MVGGYRKNEGVDDYKKNDVTLKLLQLRQAIYMRQLSRALCWWLGGNPNNSLSFYRHSC